MRVSELTRRRWQRFKSMRRAHISLWVLLISFGLSLLSPYLVNDKPLAFSFQGEIFTPIFSFYRDADFGGSFETKADYRQLFKDPDSLDQVSWSVFPPIAHSPIRSDLGPRGIASPYAPSSRHLLGTDQEGPLSLARLIYGYRNSMGFAILLTLLSSVLGVVIGGLQGYLGRALGFLGTAQH